MEFANEEKEYIKKYEEKFHVLTNEEKEYIKKYEEKFHVLTNEEKEYIIKIKRENNTDKTKKELNDFFNADEGKEKEQDKSCPDCLCEDCDNYCISKELGLIK